ncbi:MAG: universal stress protein [Isosphaeraceae bacterium]
MESFRTILFAADFSDASVEAFRMACSLAAEGRTRLHVLHVVEANLVPEETAFLGQVNVPYYDASSDGDRHEQLKQKLRAAYAPNAPIDVAYYVRDGHAAAEILGLAGELGADLIVVGTHGRTGLSWLLTGSVATSVMRRAACPVLALHASNNPRDVEQTPTILHPTDFSENSEPALRVARHLARDLGARLILLHVAPFDIYVQETAVPVDLSLYREELEQTGRRVDGQDLKYPVETRLCQGEPADEIIRTAAELGNGLIVMGTHGRTGLSRLLFGSVAEFVLPRANCPVLAVKNSSRAWTADVDEPSRCIAMSD